MAIEKDKFWSTGRSNSKPVDIDYTLEPAQATRPLTTSTYFWGNSVKEPFKMRFRSTTGYKQARELMRGPLNLECWKKVREQALDKVKRVFDQVNGPDITDGDSLIRVRLSDEIEQWRVEKFKQGKIVPGKGYGLNRASNEVLDIMGIQDLPEPLLTNGALWGAGYSNLLFGAYDSKVLYSNYCTDMGGYFEHGYHKAFPDFEEIVKRASNHPYALKTCGARERRAVADLGLEYCRIKARLEEVSQKVSSSKTAKYNRAEALAINFCESGIWGMAAEALAQGADKGGIVNDFALIAPGTDVVDVGADLNNSELFNSFLNTADVTENGIVTEDILRKVYDAYGYSCARTLTERWSEPGGIMLCIIYPWHIVNSRHRFLRRSVVGYDKIRPNAVPNQREADFDEVFDENLHTTGFSRPLKNACNGEIVCDQVQALFDKNHGNPLLKELWHYLSVAPLEYSAAQVIDEEREDELAEGLRIAMARSYAYGLVDETAWILAHGSHHAWHINYLLEAGMFGSFLDDGSLKGKLDRYDG